jgi:hypothetical protein
VRNGEDKPTWDFIRRGQLVVGGDRFHGESAAGNVFDGESVLMKSIEYLALGKSRGQIYFVQGDDELENGGDLASNSISVLWTGLTRGNLEPHELRFGGDVTAVPEDADVVVVARPRRQMSKLAVDALTDYMTKPRKKKGKLLVLLSGAPVGGKMVETGLEPLLGDMGVKLPAERLLQALRVGASVVDVIGDPKSSSALVNAFTQYEEGARVLFRFRDARPVEPGESKRGLTAEPILVALGARNGQALWREKRMDVDANAKAAEIRRNPQKYVDQLSKEQVPVAVAVSEGGGASSSPRLLVFGDANWISDDVLGRGDDEYFGLFNSCLSWLRERPDLGTKAPPKETERYILPEAAVANQNRLVVLPGALLLLAVVGLGGGVWVVRRR